MAAVIIFLLFFCTGLFMGSFIANTKQWPGWTLADQIDYLLGLLKK